MKPIKLFELDMDGQCSLRDKMEVGLNENGLYMEVEIEDFHSFNRQTFILSPKQFEKAYQEMVNAGLIGLHVPTKQYTPALNKYGDERLKRSKIVWYVSKANIKALAHSAYRRQQHFGLFTHGYQSFLPELLDHPKFITINGEEYMQMSVVQNWLKDNYTPKLFGGANRALINIGMCLKNHRVDIKVLTR